MISTPDLLGENQKSKQCLACVGEADLKYEALCPGLFDLVDRTVEMIFQGTYFKQKCSIHVIKVCIKMYGQYK